MTMPSQFTHEETALMADQHFFLAKAQIMAKVRRSLAATHASLKEEVGSAFACDPAGFRSHQLSLCEGRESRILSLPISGLFRNTFTTRTPLPFGPSFGGAPPRVRLDVEGKGIKQYKARIVDGFHQLAGQGLELSLAPTLWEWKRGEGYTLPITHDRKAQIAAVVPNGPF